MKIEGCLAALSVKGESCCRVLTVALLLMLGDVSTSLAQFYSVTDLGGIGYGINNAGQIVGHDYSDANFVAHAALFTVANGQVSKTDLGVSGGGSSATGRTINDHSQVAGDADFGDGSIHPTLFSLADGSVSPIELGFLNDGIDGHAYGINNAGQLVGDCFLSAINASHAVLYTVANGAVSRTDLTTASGATGVAYAINSFGQIVGFSGTVDSSDTRATLFALAGDGTVTLTDFGGANASSTAADINDAGQIVGSVTPTDNAASHAALWTVSGGAGSFTDLGSLGGSSAAVAINSSGQIVGYSYLSGGAGPHAFLYTAAGGMQDLNDLVDPSSGFSGIRLPQEAAHCINDSGQIVAAALVGGTLHGILLTPPAASMVSVVSASVDAKTISRGGGQVATVTFTRGGGDTTQAISVAYSVKTALTGGKDYVALKGAKKIKAGKTKGSLKIVPLSGGADGKVKVTVQPGAGYSVGTPAKVKVTITD